MVAKRFGGSDAKELAPGRLRRSWSAEERRRIVEEATTAGASVAGVARANDVNANLVFKWIREARLGRRERRRSARTKAQPDRTTMDYGPPTFVPVRIVEEAKHALPTPRTGDPVGERTGASVERKPAPPSEARCAPSREAITITLPNGARIEIGADAGEAALRLALSVVKAF